MGRANLSSFFASLDNFPSMINLPSVFQFSSLTACDLKVEGILSWTLFSLREYSSNSPLSIASAVSTGLRRV